MLSKLRSRRKILAKIAAENERKERFPEVTRSLVTYLKEHYPPRCRSLGEPVEEHERYAGKVELAEDLIAYFEAAMDPSEEGSPRVGSGLAISEGPDAWPETASVDFPHDEAND